jgi:hypothetical protein
LSKGKNDKKTKEKQGDVDKNTSAEAGYKISGQRTNIAKRTWVKPSPFHFLCLLIPVEWLNLHQSHSTTLHFIFAMIN